MVFPQKKEFLIFYVKIAYCPVSYSLRLFSHLVDRDIVVCSIAPRIMLFFKTCKLVTPTQTVHALKKR